MREGRHRLNKFGRALAAVFATGSVAMPAMAGDGGNDADDVREHYDSRGRLTHQLRLKQGVNVQEIWVVHTGDQATLRVENTPGHRRVARTAWDDTKVISAECFVDGQRTARATYRYNDDDRVVWVERQQFPVAPVGEEAVTPPQAHTETTAFRYDAGGQVIATEVRDGTGRLLRSLRSDRDVPPVPIKLSLTLGGSYQSDTNLYDVTAGLGLHRRPPPERWADDPLQVSLTGLFKFHRAAGLTSTDQTTVRFSADYHEILPRITLFTFTSTDRNVPANLRLNLEQAVLGLKLDIIRPDKYQADVSFAPVWNYRSIVSPPATGTEGEPVVENTSKLRGSFRARFGILRDKWTLLNTFEFLPTLFGDDIAQEDSFWNRTLIRNTVVLDVRVTKYLTLREEFKYTRDPALSAQASCPDDDNPLCRGYSIASTTALVLNVDL